MATRKAHPRRPTQPLVRRGLGFQSPGDCYLRRDGTRHTAVGAGGKGRWRLGHAPRYEVEDYSHARLLFNHARVRACARLTNDILSHARGRGRTMFGDEVEVTETKLPGIGTRYDFITDAGRRIGVVSHRDGDRDLLVFSKEDPDSCSSVLHLSATQADALAQVLGSGRIIQQLASLGEQISSLSTGKIRIAHGSRYDNLTLGATKARTRTGASIVALMRDQEIVPSPGPHTYLRGGDTLVVVGTAEAIDALKQIVNE